MLISMNAAEAAQRPVARFGTGACGYEGALALPRVKPGVAVGSSQAPAPGGASGVGYQVGIQPKTEQFEHMTLIDPVAQGGVGPYPAREPEPV